LLFTGRHLFDLPFRDVSDLKDARALLQPTEPTRGGRKIAKAA
jgi:hypothetical protein